MERRAKSKTLVALLSGSALVLAACGGSSSDSDSSGDAPASPLQAFLGIENVDYESEEGQAQLIAEQRVANEKIVACMAAQGFEYIPENPEDYISFDAASPDGIAYDSREWVEKYGFGVTTQRWPQEALGPDLVGYDDEQVGQEYVDPNAEYVESLSEPEREAFYAALYGDDPGYEWDESLSEEENQEAVDAYYLDYEPTGCQNEAYNSGDQAKISQFYQEFGDELNSLYEQIQQDPRYVEAQDAVKSCVEDKGLTYLGDDQIYQLWEDDLNDIEMNHVVYPGNDLTEEDFNTMTPEELDAVYNQPITIDEEGKTKLAALQTEELALAVAVDDCGGGWKNQQELFDELNAEYEQRFLDDNADAIATFAGSGATPSANGD